MAQGECWSEVHKHSSLPLPPHTFCLIQHRLSIACSSFRTYPPAPGWSLSQAAGKYSTLVFSMGCREISAPSPGSPDLNNFEAVCWKCYLSPRHSKYQLITILCLSCDQHRYRYSPSLHRQSWVLELGVYLAWQSLILLILDILPSLSIPLKSIQGAGLKWIGLLWLLSWFCDTSWGIYETRKLLYS